MFRDRLLPLFILASCSLTAQDCSIPFDQPLFGVRAVPDIWYGNATGFDGGQDSLRLNLYLPDGDLQTERPLVVCVHGGGFTGGNRNDLNALCTTLASQGFAAATISYRLGFHGPWPLSMPFAYDAPEVTRAAYRAIQDTRGAIRFLKDRSAMDSTSTVNVIVLGFSAGGITALHTAFADDPSEKPSSCGAMGDVQQFLTYIPRPDLGPIEGTLNQNGNDASVIAAVSFYGALLDTTFVDSPNDPAAFLYHQTGDPVVGCNYQQGLWGMPLGVGANYPWLYGSCVIDPRMQHLGYDPDRYEYHPYTGSQHDVHDIGLLTGQASLFMRRQFCGVGTAVNDIAFDTSMLEVSPNPTSGLLSVRTRFLGGSTTLSVISLHGARILDVPLRKENETIDLSGLSPGMYLLQVRGTQGIATQRIIVE